MKAETGRRLIHASTALVLFVHLAQPATFRGLVWSIAVLALVVDAVRLLHRGFRNWITHAVPVFRANEAQRLSGASLLWVGYALSAFFPFALASVGILAAALADPAASTVGSRFGPEGGRKSVPGSTACWTVIAAVVLIAEMGALPAVIIATAGALLERFPGPFNDNLLIAPGVTVVAWLVT